MTIPKAIPPTSHNMKLIFCLFVLIITPWLCGAQNAVTPNSGAANIQASVNPQDALNNSIRNTVDGSQRVPFFPPVPPSEEETALSQKVDQQARAQKAPPPFDVRGIRAAARARQNENLKKIQTQQNQQAMGRYVRFLQDRDRPPRYNGTSRNFTAFNSSFQSIIRVQVTRPPIFRVPPRRMNLSDIRRPPPRTSTGGGKSLSSIRRPKRTEPQGNTANPVETPTPAETPNPNETPVAPTDAAPTTTAP